MSGFTALLDGSGFDPERLRGMQTAIDHRGPDGSGVWFDDPVGLGHQKLVSTPEGTADDQPVTTAELVLVADLRLDNRGELLSSLGVDQPPETVPDSSLLATAYRAWGTACVDHLVGAFAFVLWDRTERRLFCARDHFGVRPFYYHRGADVFAAASEQKALLELPSVPARVDDWTVGEFLSDSYEENGRSFFEDIARLPPAHAMTVDSDGTDIWQYWDLDPTRTVTMSSDRAYERRFRELFEQAVESRLRSVEGVGAALSGGIDSSAITVVARDLLPDDQPLYTYSNVFDEAPSSDEREFIETVTGRPGVDSEYIFLDGMGGLGDVDGLREFFDRPQHNTMHLAVWERARHAAADVDVVMGGALGDSAIGYGLGLLPELFWTGRWRRLNRELSRMADVVGAPRKHLFVRHVLSEVVPERVLEVRRRLRGQPTGLDAANPMIAPDFVERTALRSRYTDPDKQGAAITPRARRKQRRSLQTGKSVANFETLDLAHAAFGIEPRFPFTDKRLVEFSLAIPPSQQFKDGWTRSICRRALGDLLPDKIQWRPWKTFVTEAFWNALDAEASRIETMLESPGRLDEYVDIQALEAAYERFSDDPVARDARGLWRALTLWIWLEEYAATDT